MFTQGIKESSACRGSELCEWGLTAVPDSVALILSLVLINVYKNNF